MSQTDRREVPLFQVRNHHTATCGAPPHIDDLPYEHYLGYFQNQYGEQAVFVYDHDSGQAETERWWLHACWQAATANQKEVH